MQRLAFPEPDAQRARRRVFVTVGMGPWPFDRLVAAVAPLCGDHDVVAQVGPATQRPPCPHARYLPLAQFRRLLEQADVVVTHAGNTVRLVQRLGKVPVVLARRAPLEMGNDHQVDYLREEERQGRVLAVWDAAGLRAAVQEQAESRGRLDPGAGLPTPDPAGLRRTMHEVERDVFEDPFATHPLRRYSYAWRALRRVPGRHLDLGCGRGDFAVPFASSTGRPVVAADPRLGYLLAVGGRCASVATVRIDPRGGLPFAAASFASASVLDVLEHAASEAALLGDVHQALRPGGLLVVTVPARFALGGLDPDDVKYRLPGLHRALYRARFGRAVYAERFEILVDGLRGDSAPERGRHQHYDETALRGLLERAGFETVDSMRSGLLGNVVSVGAMLAGLRVGRVAAALGRLDAELFAAANLFVTARRVP